MLGLRLHLGLVRHTLLLLRLEVTVAVLVIIPRVMMLLWEVWAGARDGQRWRGHAHTWGPGLGSEARRGSGEWQVQLLDFFLLLGLGLDGAPAWAHEAALAPLLSRHHQLALPKGLRVRMKDEETFIGRGSERRIEVELSLRTCALKPNRWPMRGVA